MLFRSRGPIPRALSPDCQPPPAADSRGFVIDGEKGRYFLTLKGFSDLPKGIGFEKPPRRGRDAKLRNESADPICAKVDLIDRAGKVLLSHDYYPKRFAEQRLAFLLYASSLLRPLALQVRSSFSPKGSQVEGLYSSALRDPLLSGGRSLGFLILHLLASAGLAFLVSRRLRALGVPAKRRVAWNFVTFLGGPTLAPCKADGIAESLSEGRRCGIRSPAPDGS